MVRTMKLAENDEFEGYDNISKINSILKIKWELYRKSFKMRLLKTHHKKKLWMMIQRCVTVFLKLAMFWVW